MVDSTEQQLGRAKNALLSFLEHRLYIPKIYLDATWAGQHLDVLAIDRDGSGDVHAILLFPLQPSGDHDGDVVRRLQLEHEFLNRLSPLQAQYKYLACADLGREVVQARLALSSVSRGALLAPDGLGRVGLLTVDSFDEEEPRVTLEVKPERFRAAVAQLANDYIEHHSADWEIRA